MTPTQMSILMPYYIALEMAKDYLALILVLLVLWIAGLALAFLRQGADSLWRRLPGVVSLAIGAVLLVLTFFLAPGFSVSALSMMQGWLDWAGLIGLSLGVGAAATILTYPWLRAFLGSPSR